jgi:endonuclease YncB( thermonuclease family)
LPSFLIVLGAVAAAVIGFAATMAFLNWQSTPRVVVLRPDPRPNPTPTQSGQIDVIDGDTVRFNGVPYRLVGIDTPERGDKARCDDERSRAEAATRRLRTLVASGDARLIRVACSCRPGQEGTKNCNYGRLCGSLSIGGRDVGSILIGEGLAQPYVCGTTSCPQRRPWC